MNLSYKLPVIGTSTCCRTAEEINENFFEECRANGIGAVEISVDAEEYEKLKLDEIKTNAEKYGVAIWSFHLPFYKFPFVDINDIHEENRKKAVEFHSEWIKKAAYLGCKVAVIHPSGEPFDQSTRNIALENSKKCIMELSEIAGSCGMTLAVEDLPRTCLGHNTDEIRYLISDAPKAGVCFDTNHLTMNDNISFLAAVKDRLVTVHVSDYDFIDERHFIPGQGKIDWKQLVSALVSSGYSGPFMYEVNIHGASYDENKKEVSLKDLRENAEKLFSL